MSGQPGSVEEQGTISRAGAAALRTRLLRALQGGWSLVVPGTQRRLSHGVARAGGGSERGCPGAE